MLRLTVVLLGCLLLVVWVTENAISHPGDGATVEAFADVYWLPHPTGQGNGDVYIESWVKFTAGTHNAGEPHEDPGHEMESLQNHAVHDTSGRRLYFKYFYELDRRVHLPRVTITKGTPKYSRSAEACFDMFGYASGKYRWGNTKIYQPVRTKSDRDWLPKSRCRDLGRSARRVTMPHDEIYEELRLAVELARLSDPTITGAVNENGRIHVYSGVPETELDPAEGMLSGVVEEIPAAPTLYSPSKLATTWAMMKQK